MTPEERFWTHVNKDTDNGCWEWTGCLGVRGYGKYTIRHNVRTVSSHKYSWEIVKGKVPDGLLVLHTCDNRKCVNPNHLYVGTHQDNMKDRSEHGNLLIGEDNPRAKLTWDKVNKIREMFNSGEYSQGQLEKIFNVRQAHISRIIRNKNWIPMEVRRGK